MLIKFTKMHGLGNDFIVIDAVTQNVRLTPAIVRRLADRKTGIGCDQLLVVEPPTQPDIDFSYRIYNSNGDEVEQCGNGARCLARFIHDRKLTGKNPIRVKTSNRVMELKVVDKNTVAVDMGIPELDPTAIPFQAAQQALHYSIDVVGAWAITFCLFHLMEGRRAPDLRPDTWSATRADSPSPRTPFTRWSRPTTWPEL